MQQSQSLSDWQQVYFSLTAQFCHDLGMWMGQITLLLAEAAFDAFYESPQKILSCLHLS